MRNIENPEIGRAPHNKEDLSRNRILEGAPIAYESGEIIGGVTPEEAKILLEKTEELPEYQEYLKRHVRIEEIADKLDSLANKKENEEEKETILMLKDMAWGIENSSFDYAKTVRKMEKFSEKEKFRLEPFDYQQKMESYDRRKRSIHESIISQLTALRRNIEELSQKNIDISPDITFSKEALGDRDYIGRWAFITAVGKELEAYREKLSQKEKEAA